MGHPTRKTATAYNRTLSDTANAPGQRLQRPYALALRGSDIDAVFCHYVEATFCGRNASDRRPATDRPPKPCLYRSGLCNIAQKQPVPWGLYRTPGAVNVYVWHKVLAICKRDGQ